MSSDCVILIVDDRSIGRMALLGLLSREGYRLESAADGPSALQIASEIIPDLILLDVMMPGMDGYEVTRQIRATKALAEVPILLVTALDASESRLEGIEAGADDFITKPFDRVELLARVRSITRLNRFRRLGMEREKYRLLFESAPCGLFVVDEQTNVRDENPLAREILAERLPPGAPRSLVHLAPPQERERLLALLGTAMAEPSSTHRCEIAGRGADQAPFWLELTVTAFPPAGKGACQVAIRDLTAKRSAEENLRHAQKLDSIGQLAGGIAHDFNNLLTAINGFSEMALDALPADSPIREMIEEVYQSGERAAALTRQLLQFSRKRTPSPVALDLNALVPNLEKMLRRLLGHDVMMRCVLAPSLHMIRADPGQIEQALVNLVINARDAMPAGGTLTIETAQVEKAPTYGNELGKDGQCFVRLIVSDTGTGMTPEVRAKIFEPFFTTKAEGKGTGLGLATVYGIVKQHDGRVDVVSEPGRGATFLLDFPCYHAEGAAAHESLRTSRLPRGTETILLAEDEEVVRSFARTALESAGYTVLAVRDGVEALREARQRSGPIDLFITDMHMPGLSAQWLLSSFRRARPGTGVLLMSGSPETSLPLPEDAVHEGFLAKPFTHVRLLETVRELLDRPA